MMLAHGGGREYSVPLGLVEQVDRALFDTPAAASFMRSSSSQHQRPKEAAGGGAGPLLASRDLQPEPVTLRLQAPSLRVESVSQRRAQLSWEPVAWHPQLPPGASIDEEIQLREVVGLPSEWRTLLRASNDRVLEVDTLRPGRTYEARTVITCQLPPPMEAHREEGTEEAAGNRSSNGNGQLPAAATVVCLPSAAVAFTTIPSLPSAPSPPALVSRERKALKVKWVVPEECGGAGPLHYTLLMSPAPDGWPEPPSAQGFVLAYSGPDMSFKATRLEPGTQYRFLLRASNRLGDSLLSLQSAFSTQATVPAQPEPPTVASTAADGIVVQWTVPRDNGSPVSTFRLERDDGSGSGEFQLVYVGPNTSALARGLRSGLRYAFRVLAENDEGKSLWSPVLVATTAAVPPSAPVGLTVVGAGRQSATLAWAHPEEAGGSRVDAYQVQLQAKCKAAVVHMGPDWWSIFDGEALAATINSLRPGCTYRARVRAHSQAGWGHYCLPVDVPTAPDVPDAPEPPTLGMAESTVLGVQWEPPSHSGGAKITRYQLEVAQAAACACGNGTCGSDQPCEKALRGHSVQMPLAGHVRTAEICDLQPGTLYFFRVQAGNSQGLGPWSEWAPLQTRAGLPTLPGDLAAASVSSTSVALRWSPSEGQGAAVTGYAVEVSEAADASAFSPVQWRPADGCGCEAKGLEPGRRYAFRVAGVNSVGQGPWAGSPVVATAPAAPGPALQLHAHASASDSVALKWQPPLLDHGAPVTGYQVEASCGGAWWTVAAASAVESCSFMVTGLAPGRLHQFRVRACNACGLGPACAPPASATTLPAPPSAPIKLQCTQRSATHLRLRWEEPTESNGSAVASYELELAEGGGSAGGADGSGAPPSSAAFRPVFSGREEQARISDLRPDSRYWLRVRAANSAGTGPFCAPVPFSTGLLPPGPPEAVEVAEEDGAALVLRWRPPAATASCAAAVSYEVMVVPVAEAESPAGGPASSSTSAEPALRLTVGKALECRLERLPPGSHFAVKLRAVGAEGAGHGAWSADVHLRTPGEAPQPAPSEAHPHTQSQNGSSTSAEAVPRSSKRAKKGAAAGAGPDDSQAAAAAARAPRAAGSSKRVAAAAAAMSVAAPRPTGRSAFEWRWFRKNVWPSVKKLAPLAPLVLLLFFVIFFFSTS